VKLYEISAEMIHLANTEGEIDVEKELATLQMQFADKARNIAGLIRNLEAERTAILDEANRLR
jgi:hypothetical protein